MALQGTLKDFSLADIFQLIGLQKKTGVLTLKDRAEVVTVSFLDGSVVAADSLPKRMEDRLGVVLVKSKQITEVQLQQALKLQKQTLKRLGTVLLEQKYLRQDALREALRIQVSQTIFRLFRWRDGEYRFSQDQKLDYDRDNILPLTAESILMEGARILDEWPMVEKRVGSYSGIFRRTKAAEQALGVSQGKSGIVLSSEEKAVLQGVDGQGSVQDLIESSFLSEFDTCRVLYELIGRELVEKVGEAGAPAASRGVAPRTVSREPSTRQSLPSVWLWGLGLLVGLSIFTAASNPLNGLSVATGTEIREIALMKQVSLTRIERIRYALQVYFLQNSGFPKDLNYLVLGGLLRSPDLRDPWGREYAYRPLVGGFELQGKDGAGNLDPQLLVRSVTALR
ncbi:MAG: DUF4388 domain-containing protein [Acidobacteria bacterium]|nr:DUF4388 domain-containing protein [Acidobacteriota bacterium]